MKKFSFLLMLALVLVLGACGSTDSSDKTSGSGSNTSEESSSASDQHKDVPEYGELIKQVGEGDYKVNVEKDDEEERVVTYEGSKSYKSIYSKNRNILKIYDMEDDHLMYNKIFRP